VPKPLVQSTGRRKAAIARVRLRPGDGSVIVNKRAIEDYFPSATHRMLLTEPLRLVDKAAEYNVDATCGGGGVSGQAGALRLGIARALAVLEPELRAP
jgi:small subunit ribosomal protein S9